MLQIYLTSAKEASPTKLKPLRCDQIFRHLAHTHKQTVKSLQTVVF